MKVDKKKSKIKINETLDVDNHSRQGSVENQTLDSGRSKRTSAKRKLEEHNGNIDTTVTIERLSKQNLSDDEPVAKKANISKRLIQVTVTSMYEDAIGRPVPIMNSTMNPNSTVTLERMMNVTVSLEPLAGKKVFNETVTLEKNSFKEPFSRNNSSKEIPESRINSKPSGTSSRFSFLKREIKLKVNSNLLSVYKYHGKPNTVISERRLAKFDVVITTYTTVTKEYDLHVTRKKKKTSRIFKV